MKAKVIVFGVSPFSTMVCALLAADDREVVARTAHERFLPKSPPGPIPFVAYESIASRFAAAEHEIFVALEHARQNAARAEIAQHAKDAGFQLASYLSPHAIIGPDVEIGEHSLILEGVVAQFGVQMGPNAIVGARTFLGQEVRIGADAYLGSAVFVERFAEIGRNCVIGSKVRIGESVKVADWTHVRAFEEVSESSSHPVFIHAALRAPARIIDRRKG